MARTFKGYKFTEADLDALQALSLAMSVKLGRVINETDTIKLALKQACETYGVELKAEALEISPKEKPPAKIKPLAA